MKKLKLLDTFSGIGGFSYAAEKLVGGFETTQFIEIDPYCQKVLKKHWPNVPIHDDIKTFTAEPFQFDAVCGGFPCQDISTAGRGKGITQETRSGLFYELIRTIRMVRPKYVILENVAAILNNGLDIVLGELSEAGYDAEWAIISASSLGACHQRSRWWLIAYTKSKLSNGSKLKSSLNKKSSTSKSRNSNISTSNSNYNGSSSSEKSRSIEKTDGGVEERKNQTGQSERSSESRDTETVQLNASDPNSIGCGGGNSKRHTIQKWQFLQREQERGKTWCKTKRCDIDSSNTKSKRLEGGSRGLQSKRLWPDPSRYNQTTPDTISQRTQIQYEQRGSSIWNLPSSYGKEGSTLSPNWQAYESEPCLRRGNDGLSNWTHRLKALGNSVVPQVAAIPLQRVKDIYEQLTSVDR
jgi:DNA-cytosine methyltransferase